MVCEQQKTQKDAKTFIQIFCENLCLLLFKIKNIGFDGFDGFRNEKVTTNITNITNISCDLCHSSLKEKYPLNPFNPM